MGLAECEGGFIDVYIFVNGFEGVVSCGGCFVDSCFAEDGNVVSIHGFVVLFALFLVARMVCELAFRDVLVLVCREAFVVKCL